MRSFAVRKEIVYLPSKGQEKMALILGLATSLLLLYPGTASAGPRACMFVHGCQFLSCKMELEYFQTRHCACLGPPISSDVVKQYLPAEGAPLRSG